jgi:hypothetical protein
MAKLLNENWNENEVHESVDARRTTVMNRVARSEPEPATFVTHYGKQGAQK